MKSLVLTNEIINQHLAKDKFLLCDGDGLYLSKRSSTAEPTFLCRFKINGKIKTRTLGSYNNLTLSQARAERDVIKKEMKATATSDKAETKKNDAGNTTKQPARKTARKTLHAHENAFNNNNNEIIQPTLNFDFQQCSGNILRSAGGNLPTIKFGGYFDIDVFANFLKLVIEINTAYIKSILQAINYLFLNQHNSK